MKRFVLLFASVLLPISLLSAQDVCGSHEGHDYVDLGLSVKWATCNVGATTPSDYGDYFAWGETSPKEEYDEDNSKTQGKGMGNIAGNPQYDVARAKWGGSWRMPTKAELEELKEKCEWTWTSTDDINGYRVTSKTNGNSIFLPAAGWRYGKFGKKVGEEGYYRSSTPYEINTYCAYDLNFHSANQSVNWNFRDCGYTIRPVTE